MSARGQRIRGGSISRRRAWPSRSMIRCCGRGRRRVRSASCASAIRARRRSTPAASPSAMSSSPGSDPMVARRSAALPRSLAPGRGPAATRPAGSGGIRAALRAFWRLALPVAAMAGATALNVLLAVAGPGPLLARLAALWQQAWAEPLFRTAALVALGLAASVALGHQQAVRRAALVAAAIAGAAVANVLVAALGAAVLPAPLVQPRIVLPVGAVAIMLAVVGWRARSLLRRLAMAEAERAPAAWILAQHRLEALWAVAPRAWSTLLGLLLAWLGLHLGLAALHLAAPATVPASSTWLELTVLY